LQQSKPFLHLYNFQMQKARRYTSEIASQDRMCVKNILLENSCGK
jgi:hypothetical protein